MTGNFVGYEIDESLKEYHKSLSSVPMARSKTIASARILKHSRFITDRETSGKEVKYINEHIGLNVMTKQEVDIEL